MSERWFVESTTATAREHHEIEISALAPWARLCHVTDAALVLGSTQHDHVVDAGAVTRRGIDVVRRRSGGGAVLVEPGAQVWLDLWVPSGDPLWRADVGEAFAWLGEAWARALGTFGIHGTVHTGGLRPGPWGTLVCFAGVGPGEVLVGGRKVVGMSQRRTRAGARFHTAALLRWSPAELLALIAIGERRRAEGAAELEQVAAALPLDAGELGRAVVAELP
jgi:lipoate-protein ligase A